MCQGLLYKEKGKYAKEVLLALLEPLDEFGKVSLLAIHKDANTVDASGNPSEEEEGADENQDGDHNLPYGYIEG